jgi:hypothetical protein
MASGSGDVTNSAEELMPPPAKKPLLASYFCFKLALLKKMQVY